jgi:methylmalonyl-CoA mutase
MTEQQINFTEGFATPTPEAWKAEVEKALKGAPYDKKMLTRTYEGITLRPLYTRHDWPADGDPSGFPGAMPFTRGGRAAGNRIGDWEVRETFAYPDPAKANEIILNELARGVASVVVAFDRAGRAGLDGDQADAAGHAGVDGVMVYSVEDLDRLLIGVDLEHVAVGLGAGGQFLPAAGLLAALWRRRRIDARAARGAFNADPLAALASGGRLGQSVEDALASLGALAAFTHKTYPGVTAVGVDTQAYHDAGATESQDLAASMATGLAYVKAMTAAGLAVDDACRQIVFSYAVPCDQFLAITKLRAARKLWARIAEASGASEPARAMRLHAVTASRMMTRRDPWVNMLRTTVACFSAAVGGADAITVQPFDAALGLPAELGRRVARNTHVVLAEESNIAKVIDPAGGSWYVETRTDDLAKAAWAEFQAIEKAGGMAAVLQDGSFAASIAAAFAQRQANIAKRRDPLTGVSEFPNIAEAPVETDAPDLAAIGRAAVERLRAVRGRDANAVTKAVAAVKGAGVEARPAAVVAAAEAGATLGALAAALAGSAVAINPLVAHRLSEAFEELRDAADAFKARTGSRPKIFLANLGAIAQHTGRATFSKNFFETAGIEAVSNEGFSDAAACAEAFKASGAKIAILCSADPVYEQMVPTVAPALKAAGCTFLFLAGNPGDKRDLYTQAGVDDFIALGGDVLATTRSTLVRLGVIER